jgi:ubiquitin C-terminal hydrolase
MNDRQAKRINEAAQRFAEALMESYKTAGERAVSAQQLNAKLTQDFFSAVIDNLHEQAEGNKALTQGLVDLQRRQLEAAQVLAQESASSYEKFLDSVFFHYGRN